MVNYFKFLNVRQIQFFPGDAFNLLKTGFNTNKTPNNLDAYDKLILINCISIGDGAFPS